MRDKGVTDRVKIYRIDALIQAIPCQFLISSIFLVKMPKYRKLEMIIKVLVQQFFCIFLLMHQEAELSPIY